MDNGQWTMNNGQWKMDNDLRSSLLPLGKADASITLLSLNRSLGQWTMDNELLEQRVPFKLA